MKKLIILALLAVPASVFAQELASTDLENLPGAAETAAAAPDGDEAVQRPDPARLMSEISSALRLSSKQEDRISAAVNKKAADFDKLLKDHEKSSAEEKKWRYKMNEARHAMQKINRNMPDTVREFLDDEQRQAFDGLIAAKSRPARGEALDERSAAGEGAVKPLKKKRVLRRKKLPAADEDAGQVMVDKDSGAAQPALRKKRVLRKKAPAQGTDAPADEPAGSKPTGKEAAAEEDAGSYP
ncbi:MAG: hypothetical protein A2X35_03725 [Elusimicrobia bacterium GWA2_61_42]|nr:MAG: hypothetical protein A2X35_03725 [Elusimicrobia bacterium GWA2_61_42]OGR77689.1 MAG: hypothetical protein A2X38_09965 [Elusimicrobia bacterium GWC2_61_25]